LGINDRQGRTSKEGISILGRDARDRRKFVHRSDPGPVHAAVGSGARKIGAAGDPAHSSPTGIVPHDSPKEGTSMTLTSQIAHDTPAAHHLRLIAPLVVLLGLALLIMAPGFFAGLGH
jgi:hypothetical protein